jgi:hypothetical protein
MENYSTYVVEKNANGRIAFEEYSLNDKLHRIDGPAYVQYYLCKTKNKNQIWYQYYYLNGKNA